MSDLAALIEKLEKAEKGERLLDFEIQVAIDNRVWPSRDRMGRITNPNTRMSDYLAALRDVISADDEDYDFPRFTTSVDGALSLIPPGWSWSITAGDKDIKDQAGCSPILPPPLVGHKDVGGADGIGFSAPLALCIAALKARAS